MAPEFRVNTYTTGTQWNSAVAELTNDRFVVVWFDADFLSVKSQRFTASGSKAGSEIQIVRGFGEGTSDTEPDVAALPGGGYIVVMTRTAPSGDPNWAISGQRYAADGTPVGGAFQVNTQTDDYQSVPAVAALADGGFVVTWMSGPFGGGGVGQDGSGNGIYAQRYDLDGNPVGDEFRVNTSTAGDQETPDVAGLAGGGFVIVWSDEEQSGAYGQRYNASGSPVGNQFLVKSSGIAFNSGGFLPKVAPLVNGGFVVAMQVYNADTFTSVRAVYARRYDASGAAEGAAFEVARVSGNGTPAIARLANGGFVVTWQGLDTETGAGISGQKYTASGVKDGAVFPVNVSTDNTQADPAVAAFDSGFVATWTSTVDLSGYDQDVLGRVYAGAAAPITGGSGPDYLLGTPGDDIIDGKGGADVMTGLGGNDLYYVQDSRDTVVEVSGEGTDTVRSSISYTLPANVERLILTGTAAINGTGNSRNNRLTGNGANNKLDGNSGADTMSGKAGNDTYYVDNSGDKVTEGVDQGIDTVRSSVTYTLPASVENLVLTGASAISGTGNTLANKLTGNNAANKLSGAAGNDVLSGGSGNDRLSGGSGTDNLTGGIGQDSFLFNAAIGSSNIDRVTDFNVADDTIRLENAVFTALTTTGTLAAAAFRIGAAAAGDPSDRILYDSATGALYYDADGNGATAQMRFATLSAGRALTSADFVVQ